MDIEDGRTPEWDSLDHPLDTLAVSGLAKSINELITINVDTIVHSNERVPAGVLEPILRRIKYEFLSPATLYALLASRLHFKQETRNDPGSAKLWRTRWYACEELALQLIPEYSPDELAQFLVFEFYPLADGTAPTEVIPTWLRVSALELAIKSEAKRFLAHPVCVQIIGAVWDGHLVLDPYVHKVHRADNIRTKWDLWRLTNARKGVVVNYDFESTTLFKPSRLRVPKYRDWLKLVNLVILILLYVLSMGPAMVSRSNPQNSLPLDDVLPLADFSSSPWGSWSISWSLSWAETLFQIWLISFIIDEFQVLNAVGSHLYFMTLWSLCDFVNVALGLVYLALQFIGALAEDSQPWQNAAHDVLAVCGVTLIPRVFSVLEASVGFSRTVISVRKMIAELLWCWIAITMFSVGFWAALAHFGKGMFSRTEVFYDLVQIMFGFTPAVWQTWKEYPPPGAMILFLYLFMAQFVVTTIVTAALSAKVVETKDNSLEEYHFLNAVRTEVRLKSERQVLYFYSQPWNILGFFPLPLLRSLLPTPWYLQSNRLLLKLTHWHVFLGIYVYERLTNAIAVRREKVAELHHRQMNNHVRSRMFKRYQRLRPFSTSRRGQNQTQNQNQNQSQSQYQPHFQYQSHSQYQSQSQYQSPYQSPYQSQLDENTAADQNPLAQAVGNGSLRDKKFELVEEVLNTPQDPNNDNQARRQTSAQFGTRVPSQHSQLGSLRLRVPPYSHHRRWSLDSDRENVSLAPSEEFIDFQEAVRDLQQSNARLEEMLLQVMNKLNST